MQPIETNNRKETIMSYEMREFVRGLGIIAVFVTFAATAIIFLVCK